MTRRWRAAALAALLALAAAAAPAADPAATGGPGFPRLMGMNIGAKNYDNPAYQRDLARLDVVILGFHKGWGPSADPQKSVQAMRQAVQAIKGLNPRVLVGQYTVLNEAFDNPEDLATRDLRDKLSASRWWLTDAAGKKVQWTAQHGAWDINYTMWAAPDAGGRRWPQWLAERNYGVYFRDIPEFDIVYLDNVMVRPRVKADWDRDGRDDDADDPRILAAHYAGHAAFWDEIRKLQPRAMLVGNTADADLSNAEWRNRLEGGFLEGLMGESWSIEKRAGWPAMMAFYRTVKGNLKAPQIVGFNVQGNRTDYRFFRYAYASCLLDDGYFSFTESAKGYSSVPWFDEYDFKLGRAVSPPPPAPWMKGVWRRDFERGVVLVNPTGEARSVTVERGLKRLSGSQDPAVNSGAPAGELRLPAKDGIVLRRDS
jgi:hypothetical protein